MGMKIVTGRTGAAHVTSADDGARNAGIIGTADGDFGAITEKILRRWQSYKGLKVDGICGPKTWASLGY